MCRRSVDPALSSFRRLTGGIEVDSAPVRTVTLEWDGKSDALGALGSPAEGLRVVEAPARPIDRAPDRVIHGDAAEVARALAAEGYRGGVDLVYLDPPYGSGVDYRHEERLDGTAGGRVTRVDAYTDRWDDAASYLDMIYPRLVAAHALLRSTGTLWVQVDWRASYLVRALCDEIFGRDRFVNEIVWKRAPNLGRQAASGQFGRTLDTIVVYGKTCETTLVPPRRLVPIDRKEAKYDAERGRWFTTAPRGDYTDESVAKLEKQGRIHRTASGSVYVKYWLETDETGAILKPQRVDALWTDVPPLRHASPVERTGYPTQKPQALLERIVACATSEGGLVVDLFAGSGTTGAAAAALGRRFILADASPLAIGVARARLLRQGIESFTLERCGPPEPEREAAIEVASSAPGRARVLLRDDGGPEPIAWAIDADPREDGPFRATWHAERGTGRRPAPLPREVEIELPPTARAISARVWRVDGSVARARPAPATIAREERA